MKILDVNAFEMGMDETNKKITMLSSQMKQVEGAVDQLIGLTDAFKGEGPQAILMFYEQYHKPLLKTYHTFTADYQLTIENMRKALLNLEPARDGYIRQSFLENELEQGILHAKNTTIELTNEANAIMQTVSDIVALPHLREDGVVRACDEALKFKDETIEKLVQFDMLQTKAVVPVDTILQSITEQIQFMEDIFIGADTSVNAQTIAVDGPSCDRDASTDIKDDKAWYETVADVIIGAIEGIVNAIVDIFKGLFDLLMALFTDPIGFFKAIGTAIFNPIDTFNEMWGAVEVAWERDVINGDARSTAAFFSYAVVSVVGLKGIDKVAKVGKLGKVASKVDDIPYNAMQTSKLKDFVKTNMYTTMQQRASQVANLLKLPSVQKVIEHVAKVRVQARVLTAIQHAVHPDKLKAFAQRTYTDVKNGPIAKTKTWVNEKINQILDIPIGNNAFATHGPQVPTTIRDVFEQAKDSFSQIKVDGNGGKGTDNLKFMNAGEYFKHINDIGKRTDLTSEQKFIKIQEAYAALEVKGDITLVSDMKFLKPEGFVDGRLNIDWPDKMGFEENSIQAINKNNPLPERWDRVGGKSGENFTVLPDNNIPYTYDQRAIPYTDNPSARHVGIFNNEAYFSAIDAIKSENLEELNRIVVVNGKNPISEIDFERFKANYNDYQDRMKVIFENVDATYGLKGTAAPWQSSTTGEKLMNGGAEQIVTPLNAQALEMIGVIPKY